MVTEGKKGSVNDNNHGHEECAAFQLFTDYFTLIRGPEYREGFEVERKVFNIS